MSDVQSCGEGGTLWCQKVDREPRRRTIRKVRKKPVVRQGRRGESWAVAAALAAASSVLVAISVLPVPAVKAAASAECTMSVENKCCSCGEKDGESFCHDGVLVGSDYCSATYCSNTVCVAAPQ